MKLPYFMEDVKQRQKRCFFSVFSTFAGGGGSSTGYRLAGGNILGINEFIPAAVETYLANYPDTHVFPQDIRKLTGKRICRTLDILPGELDILDGSPPCASFSMAGSRDKGWGKIKKYSDSSQRTDDLFFEFSRLIMELQPKVFIAENVKGLRIGCAKAVLGRKNKSNLGISDKSTILSELQNCGYSVNWKILNSADFGVPQTRERLIIIGVRDDLNIKPSFPKTNVSKWLSIREAWIGLKEFEWTDENKKYLSLSESSNEYHLFKKLKQGQRISDLKKNIGFSRMRLNYSKPCSTILQASTKSYLHPEIDRFISIDECKRIMGYPDDYILNGGFNQQWERLGRSVPPLLMKAVADHVYKEILSKIK